jgi:hypothetical protein
VLTLTERAREVLRTSLIAARRIDPEANLRIVRHDGGVRAVFAGEAEPADRLVDLGEIVIGVEAGIDGVLDAGEHNELTLVTP